MTSARGRDITENDVRTRSYLIWEREGRPEGQQLDHWLKAQAELMAEAGAEAPATPAVIEKNKASAPETPVHTEGSETREAEFGAVAVKKRAAKAKATKVEPVPKLAKASHTTRKVTTPRRPAGGGGKS